MRAFIQSGAGSNIIYMYSSCKTAVTPSHFYPTQRGLKTYVVTACKIGRHRPVTAVTHATKEGFYASSLDRSTG
jgi:hypothetical protein